MRRRLLPLVLVPLLALAACGDDSSPGGSAKREAMKPFDVVRLAGEATSESESARMAMTMSFGGVTMNGTGVTGFDPKKPEVDFTMSMDMGAESVEIRMIMLGQMMYMKMPEGAGAATPWVSLDIDALSKKSGVDLGALQQMSNADPTATLAYLEGASDDVKEVGKEEVRGEPTTKYTATLDLSKAASSVEDARAKKAVQDAVKQLGVSTLPVTIWIDDEGRMRKMVQSIDLSKIPGAPAGGEPMTITMELYEFGVDLDVTAPPADQVSDGSALLGG